MALVAHYDLELHQIDVKTAFLNGNLEDDAYMDQPVGFAEEGKEHMVRDRYMDLSKLLVNGILSSMILLCPLDLRKTLLIGVYV